MEKMSRGLQVLSSEDLVRRCKLNFQSRETAVANQTLSHKCIEFLERCKTNIGTDPRCNDMEIAVITESIAGGGFVFPVHPEKGEPDDDGRVPTFLVANDDPISHSLGMGIVAGTVTVLAGYPLDTIKVRLQSGSGFTQRASMFRGLYKGVGAPLLAVVPSWSITFLCYGATLKCLGSDDLRSCTIAGAMAGLGYSVVMCPFEFIKCNTQADQKNSGMIPVAKNLMRKYGYRGMFRGYGACMARDTSGGVTYYYFAEALNRALPSYVGDRWAPLLAGAITGCIHHLGEYPIDCFKTQMQVAKKRTTYREIWQEMRGNPVLRAGLMKGYPVCVGRAIIAHMLSFNALAMLKPYLVSNK